MTGPRPQYLLQAAVKGCSELFESVWNEVELKSRLEALSELQLEIKLKFILKDTVGASVSEKMIWLNISHCSEGKKKHTYP